MPVKTEYKLEKLGVYMCSNCFEPMYASEPVEYYKCDFCKTVGSLVAIREVVG